MCRRRMLFIVFAYVNPCSEADDSVMTGTKETRLIFLWQELIAAVARQPSSRSSYDTVGFTYALPFIYQPTDREAEKQM